MKLKITLLFMLTQIIYLQAQDLVVETMLDASLAMAKPVNEPEAKPEEEEKSAFEITGTVDVYFRSNINGDFDSAPGTSFGNLPGFSLGMANVIASHTGKNVGFTADLVAGPRGEDATFLSEELRPGGTSKLINQMFAFWNASESITFTLGNFNTFLGYEVISPTGNFNYSTSYMFSYGPFSHTGLKADFSLGNGFSLMTGIFNPTDATEFNPTNDFAFGTQLGYENDNGSAYLNSLVSEGFYQLDLTAGYNITDVFYLGLNATTAKESFYGSALYLQYATSDNFKLGTRIEYFKDNGVNVVGTDNSVTDFTLSGQYTIANVTFIPEFRTDIYSNAEAVPVGVTSGKNLSSFILAVIYGF